MKGPCSMNRISQGGAVLFVALIMLLLLTIMGLAAMRNTNLEERMAGNLRDQSIAFLASEAALRSGEDNAKSIFSTVGAAPAAYAPRKNVSVNEFGYSGVDVAKKPIYGISYLRRIGANLETGSESKTSSFGVVLRVEAQGYGVTSNASGVPAAVAKTSTIYYLR